MKLNKRLQYGMLFCLYLARVERDTTSHAAKEIGISSSFLEQVARALRIAGVIRSVRGPGGGYELAESPTVGDVLAALGAVDLMSKDEIEALEQGGIEKRAFAVYMKQASRALSNSFAISIRLLNAIEMQGAPGSVSAELPRLN